ncbi:TIGR03085 family metal-binding protein [Gordonia caeni]|uniref:TIGR03085 family metal-binding protein n=1 Tax=Gordonia caeni TaxID=1007097 RepID=A0ABP7P5R3_9ACTN
MSKVNLAQTERAGLVEALRLAGSDAPTLCTGWDTRDLAVHVLLRERRIDATAGMFVPPLAGWTGRVTRAYRSREYDDLLADIAAGPPWYSPFARPDKFLNLAEMFVHHEDVLRGGADAAGPWVPRKLPPGLDEALVLPLKTVGRLTMGKSPAAVTLTTPDGRALLSVGKGAPVTVTGSVGELLLFAFGRAPVDVALTGDDEAVDRLRNAARGL